jgi:hypothetical protein
MDGLSFLEDDGGVSNSLRQSRADWVAAAQAAAEFTSSRPSEYIHDPYENGEL